VTAPPVSHPRRTPWQSVSHVARRVVQLQAGGCAAIYRYVLRRPTVPPGARSFSYHRSVLALLVGILAVSVVELVVVDLVARRWETVRLVLLVLGLWSLVFMTGLLLGMVTRPHAVGPDGIRVRWGTDVDLELPWDVVASVALHRSAVHEKQPLVVVDQQGRLTLQLLMSNETNVEIRLLEPVPVRLPSGTESVTRVLLHADESRDFLDEVQRYEVRS
jgi:hypothetical protein